VIRLIVRCAGALYVVGAVMAFWSIPESQGRQAGPADLSHARTMASNFRPDGDRMIQQNHSDWNLRTGGFVNVVGSAVNVKATITTSPGA
jgi:hypothetical protein